MWRTSPCIRIGQSAQPTSPARERIGAHNSMSPTDLMAMPDAALARTGQKSVGNSIPARVRERAPAYRSRQRAWLPTCKTVGVVSSLTEQKPHRSQRNESRVRTSP